ncbi:MAG: hypothetical protein HY694_06645 [Deltaproteobacteria bacterium]|nr:hypothetical protein [Deltaproteobacteria bacterium]
MGIEELIRAGRAFAYGQVTGISTGKYSQIQLFNPVGSGVTIIVRQVQAFMIDNNRFTLKTYDTPLETLLVNGRNLPMARNAPTGRSGI